MVLGRVTPDREHVMLETIDNLKTTLDQNMFTCYAPQPCKFSNLATCQKNTSSIILKLTASGHLCYIISKFHTNYAAVLVIKLLLSNLAMSCRKGRVLK